MTPRLGAVLVLTPERSSWYNHTRALRARAERLIELNLLDAFKDLGVAGTRSRIERIVADEKIEIVFASFYGDSFLLSPAFLASLRPKTRVVLACYDDETAFDSHSRHYAPAVDAVVTTDYFSVAKYRAMGVPAVLNFGNYSKDMLSGPRIPRDIDVSFVGHCLKTDRRAFMDFLRENGVTVRSYGVGSSEGFIPETRMAEIFRRSKINLNFSRLEHIPWLHGAAGPDTPTMGHKGRVLEVALAGSFCLSELYPALPRVFEIGSEIDVFTDKRSLLEKVRYYLSHDAERETVAAKANARALRDYEDGPAYDRVLSELAPILSRPPAAVAAPAEEETFQLHRVNDLTVHALSMLRSGRLRAFAEAVRDVAAYPTRVVARGIAEGCARAFRLLGSRL